MFDESLDLCICFHVYMPGCARLAWSRPSFCSIPLWAEDVGMIPAIKWDTNKTHHAITDTCYTASPYLHFPRGQGW